MKLRKLILSLSLVTLTALMVSVAFACELPPGHSPGYWKHNVRVYVEGIGSYSGIESAASMEAYEAALAAALPGFTLELANMVFQDKAYKSLWLPLANAFNAVAGLAPYS